MQYKRASKVNETTVSTSVKSLNLASGLRYACYEVHRGLVDGVAESHPRSSPHRANVKKNVNYKVGLTLICEEISHISWHESRLIVNAASTVIV